MSNHPEALYRRLEVSRQALSAFFVIGHRKGIGYAGGNSLQVIEKDISRIEYRALVAVLAAVMVLLLARYFRGRRTALP